MSYCHRHNLFIIISLIIITITIIILIAIMIREGKDDSWRFCPLLQKCVRGSFRGAGHLGRAQGRRGRHQHQNINNSSLNLIKLKLDSEFVWNRRYTLFACSPFVYRRRFSEVDTDIKTSTLQSVLIHSNQDWVFQALFLQSSGVEPHFHALNCLFQLSVILKMDQLTHFHC